MAIDYYAMSSGLYADTVGDIGTNTNRRDVSELLDLWIHRETPFLNYIKWGPDSGGTAIEWMTEHQGRGYVTLLTPSITDTAGHTIAVTTSDTGGFTAAMRQICEGAVLMGFSSVNATHPLMFVNSTSLTGDIELQMITCASIDIGEKLYVIGNFANEGSVAGEDRSQERTQVTNNFAILREDVRITGSMAATDFYAVPNETRHQIQMRLKKMQKYREMSCFFSYGIARTATVASMFNGINYYIYTYNDSSTTDESTTTLTESAFNTMVANLWDAGCIPNAVFGSAKQIRKFTEWDRSRVRVTQDSKMGGFAVTKYLTDINVEVDVVPMQNFPVEFLFILDTSKIRLRAKKGRKLLVEKIGKRADADEYQLISEYSLECMGGTINTMGGAFKALQ